LTVPRGKNSVSAPGARIRAWRGERIRACRGARIRSPGTAIKSPAPRRRPLFPRDPS
jgi:hypothetical protein